MLSNGTKKLNYRRMEKMSECFWIEKYEIELKKRKSAEAKIMEFRKILDALDVEMRPKNYNLAYLRLREALL